MSSHTQLEIAITIAIFFGLAAASFVVWLVWGLFWYLYDHVMQQRTRRRNARFDARVGRDCYRDAKGLTR